MALTYKIFLWIVFFICPVLAQWEAGGAFNYKSEIPETGFSINVARKLPFQWPILGIKVRAGISIFRSSEIQLVNDIRQAKNFSGEELQADLIGTLFYRYWRPYFGLSAGVAHYTVNNFNKYILTLGILAGIGLPVTNWLQPFIEIYLNKYFSEFNVKETLREISSVQIIGKAGIVIKL